jgi:hypothetical protein
MLICACVEGGLRQWHGDYQDIDFLLQELVHFLLTRAAVPCARERALWVAGPRHDVTVVFLGFGRFAGRCCICDHVHSHGCRDAGHCRCVLALNSHVPWCTTRWKEREGDVVLG